MYVCRSFAVKSRSVSFLPEEERKEALGSLALSDGKQAVDVMITDR